MPRPRCTEYDRASTSFRPVIVPVRCAISRRVLRCRRMSLAKPCYDVPPRAIGRGTGSLWNAALSYNKETVAYTIIIDDWIIPVIFIPSPIINESSHFYLHTSINSYNGIRDTNCVGIYCTIAMTTAAFAIYSLRGILLSWRGFVRWAFPPATDTDLRRFYKEYFVDSDSEDYGILFQWKMFMGGQQTWGDSDSGVGIKG